MAAKKGLKLVLILVLLAGYAAAAQSDPWQKLNLSTTNIAGTTVHYEKCFEPNLPFFEKTYRQFLEAAQSKNTEPLQNKDQIIAEINRILETEDPNIQAQRQMLDYYTSPVPFHKPTFYLVTTATVKDFLRAGGKLPNFTYDKSTDRAQYHLQFTTSDEQTTQFAFPLKSEVEFEQVVGRVFARVTETLSPSPASGTRVGLAIHEVAEVSLAHRLRPQGPYCRWFTDGFANAITVEILKEHMSENHAKEFREGLDFRQYEDLEDQINLRYWLAGQYCVFLVEAPIKYERRLIDARYAYAMHEAQRLIDKHGVDCVRKILDALSGAESRTGDDISSAIEKVTGEDMDARLDRYQTFGTREEGIPKYTVPFNAASKNNDYEKMLINLLRLMELHEFQYSPNNLQSWTNAALLLFKMGYEKTGDEVMQNCISLFEHSPVPGGREAALEAFIIYAFKCGKPEKAREVAPQLLKTQPESVLALTVEMLSKVSSGKIIEAREMARKIQALTKGKETVSYKAAAQVLANEPNQP